MADLETLLKQRADLVTARSQGIREVRDSTGESMTHKSDREMAGAMAFLDAEIAKARGVRRNRFAPLSLSKGL